MNTGVVPIPKESPKDLRLLISAKRAAELLSISTRLLWTMTNMKEIPHMRLGRRVLYSPADLAVFIETRKTIRAT